MAKRAIIKTGYICNNRCLFCRVGHYRESLPSLPFEKITAKIDQAKSLGVEMVLFSGGEPTMRRDIADLMRQCRNAGLKCGLITNARMLAYKGLLEKLADAGLSYIHTSLHGSDASVHNRLTMSDSFSDLITALENIRRLNIELHVNTVVNKANMADLRRIADLLSRFAPLNYKMSLVEPSGFFAGNTGALLEKPSILAECAKITVSYGVERHSAKGMTFGLEGFSLCHIRDFEKYVDNLFTHGIEYMSEAYEAEFFPVDHGPRIYPEKCRYCALRDRCPGVYKGFYEIYGEGDLHPIIESS